MDEWMEKTTYRQTDKYKWMDRHMVRQMHSKTDRQAGM